MIRPQLLISSIRPRTYGVLLVGTGTGFYTYHQFSSSKPPKVRHLNPSTFTSYTLVSKAPVSSSSSIFRLRPQHKDAANSQIVKEAFDAGIWSVQFKQPQLQIARNYTPLPDPEVILDEGEMRVLIRREEGGEVSGYLHDLPERSTIAIRGPFEECHIPSDVTDVLFLAGGTGIAPALQTANLLKSRSDLRIQILWANRRREDCIAGGSDEVTPPNGWRSLIGNAKTRIHDSVPDVLFKRGQVVQLLEQLKDQGAPGHLCVDYFVDEEKTFISPNDVSRALERPRGEGKALILISGPEGFMEYWAGKKEWAMGRETQGVLGGQLADMDRKGWTIIKI